MRSEESPGRHGRIFALALALLGAFACDDSGTEPDPTGPDLAVETVEVTSPIDTLLAVGWTAQLEATARDAAGGSVSSTFSWVSSAPTVATVDADGEVSPLAPGTAQISATAEGVTGDLRIRVIAADVDAAAAVFADPLVDHFAGGLDASAATVDATLSGCTDALAAGNLVAADGCIEAIRAAAAAATDADERVLLAVLLLLADHAGRLLTL